MSKKVEHKKIGFLLALIISVGSTLGHGIFFKNESILINSGGSMTISIMSWVVSAFGMVAIGLALVQLTANNRKSNGGVLAWTNDYAAKWFHKISRGFMFWFFLPVAYISMPLYNVMTIVNTFEIKLEWYWFTLIALAFILVIGTINQISVKFASIMQTMFVIFMAFPIIFTIIVGFSNYGGNDNFSEIKNIKHEGHIQSLTSGIGIIASIPAIFFSYDGFYASASIKSDLKDPKKNLPKVMGLSIFVVTILYLSIATALLVSSPNGTFQRMHVDKNLRKVIGIGISLATLGIINGFTLITPKIYEEFIKSEEINGHSLIKKLFKKNQGWWTSMIVTFFTYLVFIPIGAFLYYDESNYSTLANSLFTKEVGGILSLMDLLTNWTSLLIFVIIGGSILGALKHFRKSEEPVNKYFKITAIISIIFISIAALYMITDTCYELGYAITNHLEYKGPLLKLILLLGTIVFSWVADIGVEKAHHTERFFHDQLSTFKHIDYENKE